MHYKLLQLYNIQIIYFHFNILSYTTTTGDTYCKSGITHKRQDEDQNDSDLHCLFLEISVTIHFEYQTSYVYVHTFNSNFFSLTHNPKMSNFLV